MEAALGEGGAGDVSDETFEPVWVVGFYTGGGKRVVASADVAEELPTGDWVGDEGDAAASVSAVGAAEDVYGKGSLEQLCPGLTVRILVAGGGVGLRRGRDDAIAKRGGGGEGTVRCSSL